MGSRRSPVTDLWQKEGEMSAFQVDMDSDRPCTVMLLLEPPWWFVLGAVQTMWRMGGRTGVTGAELITLAPR